jgi:hypothetical protein
MESKLAVILARFGEAYARRYKRLPPTLIDGMVQSILAGELKVMVDEPEYSPLREIMPLLREATTITMDAFGVGGSAVEGA